MVNGWIAASKDIFKINELSTANKGPFVLVDFKLALQYNAVIGDTSKESKK